MNSHQIAEITDFRATVFKIPTETFEADGTFEWDSTTLLLVELCANGKWGLGYTYGHRCLAMLVEDLMKKCVAGQNAFDIPLIWENLLHQIRNNGEVGLTAMGISAIDHALWDLKAKCLDVSLCELLGRVRDHVPVYGSGGFTNYSDDQLRVQLSNWLELGISRFKIKVGRDIERDLDRVRKARQIIGDHAELFVDANGAYDFQTALKISHEFARSGVSWYEQPILPSDLEALEELKRRLPPGMNLASGEYIYDLSELSYRLKFRAQHFIQLDSTRCKGITGFVKAVNSCELSDVPVSSHCAPSLHVALGCAFKNFKHIEYFFDHSRIENLIFTGVPQVQNGCLSPQTSKPGNGLELNRSVAEKYRQ
jgi:L-alanine-DL-glutamate epimerase-like enolase superfamily enzyme